MPPSALKVPGVRRLTHGTRGGSRVELEAWDAEEADIEASRKAPRSSVLQSPGGSYAFSNKRCAHDHSQHPQDTDTQAAVRRLGFSGWRAGACVVTALVLVALLTRGRWAATQQLPPPAPDGRSWSVVSEAAVARQAPLRVPRRADVPPPRRPVDLASPPPAPGGPDDGLVLEEGGEAAGLGGAEARDEELQRAELAREDEPEPEQEHLLAGLRQEEHRLAERSQRFEDEGLLPVQPAAEGEAQRLLPLPGGEAAPGGTAASASAPPTKEDHLDLDLDLDVGVGMDLSLPSSDQLAAQRVAAVAADPLEAAAQLGRPPAAEGTLEARVRPDAAVAQLTSSGTLAPAPAASTPDALPDDVHLLEGIHDLQQRAVDQAMRPLEHAANSLNASVQAAPATHHAQPHLAPPRAQSSSSTSDAAVSRGEEAVWGEGDRAQQAREAMAREMAATAA